MNKIIVYRTHIEVINYELGDLPTIEKTFSIYDALYHTRYPKGMIYDKEKKILMLPRGIDIDYLSNLLHSEPVISDKIDPTEEIDNILLKYKPRDETQKEAIKFMLSVDKYRHNNYSAMFSVNLNTGKGKTFCSIATAAYLGLRPIVITDNIGWLNQWKGFFIEYTNTSPDEIYLISGTPSLMKLYNRDVSKYKVILSTHSTIKSVGDTQGWEKISDFFSYCKIGVKFFDEAHLNFDNMFKIDCFTNTFLTYYLTATPGRSDSQEDNIFNLYFKNTPKINLFNIEEDPHTKYASIKFNSQPTPVQAAACKNNYGLNRIAYIDYLVHNENFKLLTIIIVNMAINKPGKHLFYVGTNEAILYIRECIYSYFPELIGQVGIYTSIIPVDKKKNELNKKIILSTTKSAGAAMDIKGLTETVNLAEPFKSKVLAQQTFGRTRDDNTIYKDIVDTGFFYTKKFYEHKKPVFKKYATKCIEINMKPEELSDRVDKIIEYRSKLVQAMDYYENSNDSSKESK